jgi:hypothetical protein
MSARWFSVLILTVLSAACSSEGDTNGKQCPKVPAFSLTLRAAPAPLPDDTVLKVTYGGGSEEYALGGDNSSLETVLCSVETDDAGSGDGGKPRALAIDCKLWTQGAAKVTASGDGFPDVSRELESELDGNCVKTVPVELVLGDLDGGS